MTEGRIYISSIDNITHLIREEKMKKQTIFPILGAGLIALGIIFISLGRVVSYSFIGVGVLLLIISLIKGLKKK